MDNPLKSTRLTIKDVAKALNVSTTTVSRALSGKGRISEDTVQRVQAFIKENNYVPNAIAQSLADQRTYNIGFIMPRGDSITDHTFFQDCGSDWFAEAGSQKEYLPYPSPYGKCCF